MEWRNLWKKTLGFHSEGKYKEILCQEGYQTNYLAAKIFCRVSVPYSFLTVSIGIYYKISEQDTKMEEYFQKADKALYRKREGKNRLF